MTALLLLLLAAEPDPRDQLTQVRRVYVDRFTGGESAAQLRELIMSSLDNARLFVITENPDRADTVLRGMAEDLVFTETHSSSESLHARASVGRRTEREDGVSLPSGGVSVGDSESSRIQERRHEATAAVRLVNKDGDVIWSTTQESRGAKFLSASADVADKITRQLKQDWLRVRKPATPATAPRPAP